MIQIEDTHLPELLHLASTAFDNPKTVDEFKRLEKQNTNDDDSMISYYAIIIPDDTKYKYHFTISKTPREKSVGGWFNFSKIDASYFKLNVDLYEKQPKNSSGSYSSWYNRDKIENLEYHNSYDKNRVVSDIWNLFKSYEEKLVKDREILKKREEEIALKAKNQKRDDFFQDIKKGIQKDSARDIKLKSILND